MEKRLCFTLLFALAFAVAASAAPTYCVPGVTTTLATVGGAPTGATITCGTTVFSNFAITDAGNAPSASLVYVVDTATILNGSYYDPATGFINLVFNPNLADNNVFQDVHVVFNVNDAVQKVYQVGGSAGVTGVQEIICSGNNNVNPGSGACINGATQLAALAYPPSTTVWLNPASGQISVWKDASHAAGSHLTGFTQSFTTTPEPATFAMLGGGLLALAFARRKRA